MKHLKKYKIFESLNTLDSLSDDQLEDRLKWLRVELEDLTDQISAVNKVIIDRKEKSESKKSESLPNNVYDLDEEQFNWLFEHHHGTTSEKYKIAQTYIGQLKGVHQTGFNPDTKQFYFSIGVSYFMNDEEDEFIAKEEGIKSINFLSKNLKKNDGYVKFGISYYYSESYNDILLINDDDIKYGSFSMRKVDSIEKFLEEVVTNDLLEKDGDYY